MKTQTELSELQKFYKKLDELEIPYESRAVIIEAAADLSIDSWMEGYEDAKNTWK